MASMEHPLFSLSTKPDMRELEYDYRGNKIKVVPSGIGLATVFDKDIHLYGVSKSIHEYKETGEIPDYVEMTAHECMVATNWLTSKHQYERFEQALIRLRGTTIVTNVKTGGQVSTHGFGLIDEFHVLRVDENGEIGPFGRLHSVKLKLSNFTKRAIKSGEMLVYNPLYFRLRSPIDRRLYEIARKHMGNDKDTWQIKLENLQAKVGSNAPLKKFRFVIKQSIADGNVPDYAITLDKRDLVTFSRLRVTKKIANDIRLKQDTLERGKKLAVEKGYDFYGLQDEWLSMVSKRGMPDNPDGAFIGFIKSKKSLRQQQLL